MRYFPRLASSKVFGSGLSSIFLPPFTIERNAQTSINFNINQFNIQTWISFSFSWFFLPIMKKIYHLSTWNKKKLNCWRMFRRCRVGSILAIVTKIDQSDQMWRKVVKNGQKLIKKCHNFTIEKIGTRVYRGTKSLHLRHMWFTIYDNLLFRAYLEHIGQDQGEGQI